MPFYKIGSRDSTFENLHISISSQTLIPAFTSQTLLVSYNNVTFSIKIFYDKTSDKTSQYFKLYHYHHCYNFTSLQHTNKLAFENCFRLLILGHYVIYLHWITRKDKKEKKIILFFLFVCFVWGSVLQNHLCFTDWLIDRNKCHTKLMNNNSG